MPCGHSYSAAKATGEKKMMANETSVHEQHLSRLALFLYERGTHIPRGLALSILDEVARISRKNMRSTFRPGIFMRLTFLLALFLFTSAQALALTVTISAKAEGGDKPIVIGTTNLPDGIELMISLRRKEINYMAEDKTRVKGGAFRAGPFSQNGADLNPGIYILEVATPLASLQPPPTWPVIGNDGANLDGPSVKKSKFGGKVVEYKTSFKIGSGQLSAKQDKAVRAQSEKDTHSWWLRSCKDTCKVTQNLAQKRSEAFDWERC